MRTKMATTVYEPPLFVMGTGISILIIQAALVTEDTGTSSRQTHWKIPNKYLFFTRHIGRITIV